MQGAPDSQPQSGDQFRPALDVSALTDTQDHVFKTEAGQDATPSLGYDPLLDIGESTNVGSAPEKAEMMPPSTEQVINEDTVHGNIVHTPGGGFGEVKNYEQPKLVEAPAAAPPPPPDEPKYPGQYTDHADTKLVEDPDNINTPSEEDFSTKRAELAAEPIVTTNVPEQTAAKDRQEGVIKKLWHKIVGKAVAQPDEIERTMQRQAAAGINTTGEHPVVVIPENSHKEKQERLDEASKATHVVGPEEKHWIQHGGTPPASVEKYRQQNVQDTSSEDKAA